MKSIAWIYPALGVGVALVFNKYSQRRGVESAIAAWLLCAVPFVVAWVAGMVHVRKKSLTRGSIENTVGTAVRLIGTLAGAAGLYLCAGERLGPEFWVALLVFYLTALAVRTRQSLDRLRT